MASQEQQQQQQQQQPAAGAGAAGATADPTQVVLIKSEPVAAGTPICRGYDFAGGPVDYDKLLQSMLVTGFQATSFGQAVERTNEMLNDDDCQIFLGFTSNMISCGVREALRFVCEHKMVSCIVTSGGAVEEDLMKCLAPHYMGDFDLKGEMLRRRGQNRIGNLIVENNNYCLFDDFMTPLLDRMLEERREWTPSEMIRRFGQEIDNPDSVWYWCAKNDIPVFCPAITDGSIGDMIYFHSFRQKSADKRLVVDIARDVRILNDLAAHAPGRTGMLILGGGVIKHHICNANLMRNGADYSVYINTGISYDGSDAGASPDEAVSWGKIKLTAKPVKVYGDASLVFPLLVAQTFAKQIEWPAGRRRKLNPTVPEWEKELQREKEAKAAREAKEAEERAQKLKEKASQQ